MFSYSFYTQLDCNYNLDHLITAQFLKYYIEIEIE